MLKDETLSEEEQREERIKIFEETENVLKKLDKDDIKIKIIEFINEIERVDILEYIYNFITIKFKAGK